MDEAQDIATRDPDDRENEERAVLLNALIQTSPLAIVVVDRHQRVRMCNEAFEHLFLYPQAGIVGTLLDELIAPQDKVSEANALTRRAIAGEKVKVITQRRRKDGGLVDVEVFGVPLRVRGELVGGFGFYLDISERQRSEESLKESEERYRAVVEQLAEGIILYDVETKRILEANSAYRKLLGYSPEDILQLTLYDIIAGDHEDIDRYVKRILSDKSIFIGERRHRRKDGNLVDVEVQANLARFGGKEVMCVVVRDIAERKRAAEALRGSEERFRTLFENTVIGLYRTTSDGRILMANPALLRMLGYESFAELAQRNLEDMSFEPTYSRAEFKKRMARDGQALGMEFSWKKRDGKVLYVRESARVIRDAQGNILYYEGTAEDITESQRAKEALRESESRNRAILDALPDLMFIQDLSGVYLDYHASNPSLLLLPPERFLGKNMHEVLPPELAARFDELFERLREGSATQLLEYPLRLSGETRHFEARMVACGRDRVLSLIRDITESKRAEAALRQRQREVATLLDSLPAYAYFKKAGSIYVAANRKFCEAVGCSPEEIAGKTDYDLFPRELAEKYRTEDARMVITGETVWVGEDEMVDRGRRFVVEARKVPVTDEKGTVVGLIGLGFDITERKQLEEQLLQSQKMEAVGRLASGVAHDFNNILTAIMGYSDALLSKLPEGDPLCRYPEEIIETINRASNLTNQLLAFSRRQDVQPEILNVNDVVSDMDRMLRRLISEEIEMVAQLDPDLGPVKADPVQIEQIIMNLVVNSRDAMLQGGTLTIQTANIELDEGHARSLPALLPGPYIVLSVTDTGCGMSPEVQSHLFEPFFTTKEKGKGTGLGLSTVYGIVKQSGGHIEVQSTPGKGSAFKVYLPRVEEVSELAESSASPSQVPRGSETVLVAEDDEAVRKRACEILESYGYAVLEAGHGEEALKRSEEHPGAIDLLVADVVMPKLSGPDLARRLASSRPKMKVLFMSGYTDGELAPYGVLREGASLLRKPFKPEVFARKVRALLDIV